MKNENDKKSTPYAIGIGMALGAIIGLITGNIALWLSLGLVFGAGYEMRKKKR